ncbi:MAG: YraN family protein [Pseudomonadota bacterium]
MPEAGGALAHQRGRAAESLARVHLEGAGLKVVAANRRLNGGELDLVAWEGPVLVFVEVKGRALGRAGAPEEAVDRKKRQRLVAAAQAFLAQRQAPEPPCRFDVVAVEFGPGGPSIRHLRDAFRPGD